jgi:hypothetical protein
MSIKNTGRRILVTGVILAVAAAGCGGDGTESSEPTADTVLINTASGSVAVTAADVAGTATTVAGSQTTVAGTTGSTSPLSKTISTSPNSPSKTQSDDSGSSGNSAPSSSSSAPGSNGTGSTVPSFDDAPTIVHKFTLNAMTIQMKNQDNSICIQPCRGYYLGWNSNFNDNNRRIIYSNSSNGYKDIIANLVAGDAGNLLVMYQASQSASPQIAARYPFSFTGSVTASYNTGVSERLTYSYNGNAIEILLKGSNGATCPQPCNGYYLGWSADFDDNDRTITYSSSANGYKDIIGGLRVGDSGQLLLMNNGQIRGRAPFIYLG